MKTLTIKDVPWNWSRQGGETTSRGGVRDVLAKALEMLDEHPAQAIYRQVHRISFDELVEVSQRWFLQLDHVLVREAFCSTPWGRTRIRECIQKIVETHERSMED